MIMQNVAKALALFCLFAGVRSSAFADKPSLKAFSVRIQQGSQITAFFKKTQDLSSFSEKEFHLLWKVNQKSLRHLEIEFQNSSSFVRGEVEDEKVLSAVIQYLQLSLLQVRQLATHSDWKEVKGHLEKWFLFAADFPYEEASLVGLRFSGVVRSLLLDEMERLQVKYKADMAKEPMLRQWFLQVRAPWPVDRVIISESRRLLKPNLMSVANAAAQAFQKNPYQTSESVLKKIKNGNRPEAEFLRQIWREADILMMKTEMNRIGKMKLRLALAEYQQIHSALPPSSQELVKAGLLDQVPTDYLTGKALDLTSL